MAADHEKPMAPVLDISQESVAAALRDFAPATSFDLSDRVAVLTGAAGGLGRWFAVGLAAAGASLVLTDRDDTEVKPLAQQLQACGSSAVALSADLSDAEAPHRVIDFARERMGRVDILINNAAVNRRLPILDIDSTMLEWIWTLNFRQPYLLSQQAARVMIDQGGGSIINISSINAHVGVEDVSLYGPTKAALSQLTKVMAIEWSRFGIRSNAIAPGFFATPMNDPHWTHPTRAPWIIDRIPLCRPGMPAELVGLCVLLASDAGSYITGQTICVDGGFTAGSRWNDPAGSGLAAFRKHGGFGLPRAYRSATTTSDLPTIPDDHR
ncbi:MAG: SDR family NAD(P)-dependent oxidoreductase [Candidatus Limnocylindrales bacterium]